MGNNVSAQVRANKYRSDTIDRQLEEDAKKLRNEYKVLLLGPPGSGRSTIIKQMKIIHQNSFSKDELMERRPVIYDNLLGDAQSLILAMCKLGVDCVDPINQLNTSRILDYRIESSQSFTFSEEIADAIHDLWKDPAILQLMNHSNDFHLTDSAQYFFSEAKRIGSPNYIPTETDILHGGEKKPGVIETRFSMGSMSITIVEVRQPWCYAKKWIHMFENVTSIIYCTSLSEYDNVLPDESNQNCMLASMVDFEAIINSRWFLRTSIILFLNKFDIFKGKLAKVPLERYFPEYTGGPDVNKAAKYILWRFMQTNRARLSVYPHLMQVTDTTNLRLVLAAVKETVLQNALRGSQIDIQPM